MNHAQLKEQAKSCLQGNYGTVIAAWLLSSLLLSAASGVTGGIASIFAGVLVYGLTGIYMSVIRTRSSQLEGLFSGFHNFANSFLAGLLVDLFTFLWSLLFIIPGIVKSYSYAMTFYILNDEPELSGNEAITKSREMMNGHKGELFLLDLSFIGWHLLSILTCGLLYLYVTPYVAATKAAFYEELKMMSLPETPADGGNGGENSGENGNGSDSVYTEL